MSSGTYTIEYTILDVRHVLGSFAAEFAMMVSSSGVDGWTRQHIEEVVSDLVAFADSRYVTEIDVTLLNGLTEIRAARYVVTDKAQGWSTDRPGNNLWPSTPGGRIRLTAVMSSTWEQRSGHAKAAFIANLNLPWPDSGSDLTHSQFVARQDRRFASNGFGLEKLTYGS